MKKLILLLLIPFLVNCRTELEKEQARLAKSRKLFLKAQELNPNLLQTIGTKYVIDTLILYKDTLYLQADTNVFAFHVDTTIKDKQVIFENKKIKVSVQLDVKVDSAGKVAYKWKGEVVEKPQTITRTIPVTLRDTVSLPAKVVNVPYPVVQTIKEKGFFYYSGIIFWIISILFGGYRIYHIFSRK